MVALRAWASAALLLICAGAAALTALGQPGPQLGAPAPPSAFGVPTALEPALVADAKVEAKIAELEKRLHELEASKGAPDKQPAAALQGPIIPVAAQAPPDDNGLPAPGQDMDSFNSRLTSPPFANMPEGFVYRSPNNQHEVRIIGQLQFDFHDYPRHGDTTDTDTFLIRRARLGIEGDLFNYYEFRLLPDFGNNKVVIQDAFMNIHYWNEFQFEVGKFKEPVSYEQAEILDRFVPTVERSIIDQITPARDIGMMIHGEKLLNNQLEYALGVFNGEINADTDTNKIKDFAGYISWKPFNYSFLPDYLHLFQIGISGTAGKEQEALSLTGVGNETLKTSAGIPWLTFVKNAYADGIRTRCVPEAAYFYNEFGLLAEYMRMDQDIQSGSVETVKVKVGKKTVTQTINDLPEDVRFGGYMFTATCFLTGEHRTTYSELTYPLRPFDARHPFTKPGAGSWWPACRICKWTRTSFAPAPPTSWPPPTAIAMPPPSWSSASTGI